jgi:hypothetical protein
METAGLSEWNKKPELSHCNHLIGSTARNIDESIRAECSDQNFLSWLVAGFPLPGKLIVVETERHSIVKRLFFSGLFENAEHSSIEGIVVSSLTGATS